MKSNKSIKKKKTKNFSLSVYLALNTLEQITVLFWRFIERNYSQDV